MEIKVGTELYLRQFTNSYYINMVKRPYTVIKVSEKEIVVQEAKLIYPIFRYDPNTMTEYYKEYDGKRVCFYDTVAEKIEPDPNGRTLVLTYHPKRNMWGTKGSDSSYPLYAVFGKYEHQPYLD